MSEQNGRYVTFRTYFSSQLAIVAGTVASYTCVIAYIFSMHLDNISARDALTEKHTNEIQAAAAAANVEEKKYWNHRFDEVIRKIETHTHNRD